MQFILFIFHSFRELLFIILILFLHIFSILISYFIRKFIDFNSLLCLPLIQSKLRVNILLINPIIIGSHEHSKESFTFEGVSIGQDGDGTFRRELLISDWMNFSAPRIATHPHEMARAIGPYRCLKQLPATR